jgi:hypothetical protein
MRAALFLFDRTGNMAQPWAGAGYQCWCVDVQHSIRRPRVEGNINFVWGDARSWTPPAGVRFNFVAAFPPCTDVAGSGARDFETKRGALLRDALELFETARLACAYSGAPYMIENPVGVLSSIPHIGKPDFYFDPWQFAGYADDPAADAYTKRTCLWTGNGFVMPTQKPVEPIHGSKMWRMAPSDERANERSATPMGFARAVFQSNAIQELKAA